VGRLTVDGGAETASSLRHCVDVVGTLAVDGWAVTARRAKR